MKPSLLIKVVPIGDRYLVVYAWRGPAPPDPSQPWVVTSGEPAAGGDRYSALPDGGEADWLRGEPGYQVERFTVPEPPPGYPIGQWTSLVYPLVGPLPNPEDWHDDAKYWSLDIAMVSVTRTYDRRPYGAMSMVPHGEGGDFDPDALADAFVRCLLQTVRSMDHARGDTSCPLVAALRRRIAQGI